MLAVRCDACGMKALVAASQCPHCAHPLDIRDSFGEIVPLVHCPTCDASYRRSEGACRWCGTTAERVNLRPYVWKGVGVLAFAGMAVGAWLTRDLTEPEPPQVELANVPQSPASEATHPPTAASPIVQGDSLLSPADTASAQVERDSTVDRLVTGAVVVETLYLPTPGSQPLEAGPGLSEAGPPASVAPAQPKAVRAPPRTAARRPVRWTTVVVTSWATVRAGPSRSSRLLGSVGPDSHVQIGEVRGDWQRVRMSGLSGWVENGRFSTRRLASQRR